MSYKYRRERRNCAHYLLQILSNNLSTDENRSFIEYSSQGLNKIHNTTPGTIWQRFKKYSPTEIYEALILLKENGDIIFDETGIEYLNSKIVCRPKGKISYKSGFYEKENQKDFVEIMELKTKWIIPVISIIFSIAAFSFSIYTFLHPHK